MYIQLHESFRIFKHFFMTRFKLSTEFDLQNKRGKSIHFISSKIYPIFQWEIFLNISLMYILFLSETSSLFKKFHNN